MKSFFRAFFFLLGSDGKKKLPYMILLFFFSSLLDVIGIGLVGAFLLLIVNIKRVLTYLPPNISRIFANISDQQLIFLVGAILIFAFIGKSFVAIYSQKKIVQFTSQTTIRIKIRLMRDYQNANYHFHLMENSGHLINRMNWVDQFCNNTLMPLLNLFSSSIVIIGILVSIFILHPIITLFLFLMLATLICSYLFFAKNKLTSLGKSLALSNGEIYKNVLHALHGLKEVRVLGKESYFSDRLKNAAAEYSYSLAAYNALQLVPRYVVETVASIFLVVLVLGALICGIKPIDMIPTLGIFAAASIRLLPIVSQLVAQLNQIKTYNYVAVQLYEEISTLENEYALQLMTHHSFDKLPFSVFSLKDIFFRYPAAKHHALNHLNLTIQRGHSIGFMGTSGAGKSTLSNVILGLLAPDAGELLVDGKPIRNQREWLNNFAYIPQMIFLLDDTLKRNVALGIEDNDIDEKKLYDALALAQLATLVDELPQGVDTLIGENGVRLSGGQRQRIALARAFYHERDIIVMDEATSALDNETENEIIHAIKSLHGVKTLLVIAHRLTTIQHCDVIYRLEKGRIVAQGSYAEVVGA